MMIRALVFIAVALLGSGALPAREVLWQFAVDGLSGGGMSSEADLAADGGLMARNPDYMPTKINILTIGEPGISLPRYAITGQVRHRLRGRGYLEMVSHFANGEVEITRYAEDDGPMRSLEGSTDWREFSLPFFLNDDALGRPVRLEINAVLPPGGLAWFDGLALIEYDQGEDPLGPIERWWSGPWSLGLGLTLGLILGGMITLVEWLSQAGRARRSVYAILIVIGLLGVSLVAVGFTAIWNSQPWHVSLALFISGSLCMALPLATSKRVKRMYEDIELRRMSAMDLA